MKKQIFPEIFSENNFPSMDGLRAISIIFVIIAHLNSSENAIMGKFALGSLGVFKSNI